MTSQAALERLVESGGLLTREAPDRAEYEGLVRSGLKRLTDAENTDLSLEETRTPPDQATQSAPG